MVTLTIQLDDSIVESLRKMARERNRSEAELIRDAIACYAAVRTQATPKGVGAYRSGSDDVSENARSILRDAVEGGQWP